MSRAYKHVGYEIFPIMTHRLKEIKEEEKKEKRKLQKMIGKNSKFSSTMTTPKKKSSNHSRKMSDGSLRLEYSGSTRGLDYATPYQYVALRGSLTPRQKKRKPTP